MAEDGRALTKADDAELSAPGQANIRPEGPGLQALTELVRAVVERVQRLQTQSRATLDVDATIIEALERQALVAYEGTRGYQPQMAWWAEQRLWVCDEFRDGNVPAEYKAKAYLQRAFGALPASVKTQRLRADSALYNEEALTWADEAGIDFAVSADMSEALRRNVLALSESAWKPYRSSRDDTNEERQWAEVVFVPEWARNHKREGEPFRYLAIRVRSKQHDLLVDDAARWRHFAVVTQGWAGAQSRASQALGRRAPAAMASREAGHRRARPRYRQGRARRRHAALWPSLPEVPTRRGGVSTLRLVHNLFTLLQTVLPEPLQAVRPKALRFRLLNVAGHIVRHARTLVLRLSSRLPAARIYAAARQALLDLAAAGPPEPAGA